MCLFSNEQRGRQEEHTPLTLHLLGTEAGGGCFTEKKETASGLGNTDKAKAAPGSEKDVSLLFSQTVSEIWVPLPL